MSKYMKAIRLLAKMEALDADNAEKLINAHMEERDGGPGSGNYGHAGRPGKRGGSAAENGGSSSEPSGGSQGASEVIGSTGGSSWTISKREPVNYASIASKFEHKKRMRAENMKQADKCFEEAKKWPVGSEERGCLERYADILSKPLTGRPTKEESEALAKEYLGKISLKLKEYAVNRYKKDLENEPQITNDICDIADSLGTSMYGLSYRLKKASDNSKGVCRIEEKINEDIADAKEKGETLTYEEAVDNLSDMVRYTQACTADSLVDNFEKTKAALEKKGYKVAKIKNTWNTFSRDRPYRGVNCVFVSPTGTRFELQFHTPESLVAKELQHPWYEETRSKETPPTPERKAELDERMYQNMSKLKPPRGIERIENYPKKS